MVEQIRANGISVITLESQPDTPDAVFPNNWFSTHLINNQLYLFIYPMCTENRRKEVQINNLVRNLQATTGNNYKNSGFCAMIYSKIPRKYWGCFIFDHEYKIAYMSVSPRADAILAKDVCDRLGVYINNIYKLR